MRVAVLGANGQVGAEVCLLLRNLPEIELVPIVRNRLGSAFLRYSGLACRHGRIADPGDAARLIGDCDVVANFALGAGTLAEARKANRELIRNSILAAPQHATILYFSTISVYPNPKPGKKLRWGSWYGREKLACESYAMQVARESARRVFVLRLGHVCGELQNITSVIRGHISSGPIRLPDPERASNTTYIAAIADAIVNAPRGRDLPGVYDLQNVPVWTWRQVYEHEARASGGAAAIEKIESARTVRPSRMRRAASRAMQLAAGSPERKELVMQWVAKLSPATNQRIQATYYRNRAAAEIAALRVETPVMDATEWRPVGERFLTSLTPTHELLSNPNYRIQPPSASTRWPADLPPAQLRPAEAHP